MILDGLSEPHAVRPAQPKLVDGPQLNLCPGPSASYRSNNRLNLALAKAVRGKADSTRNMNNDA